MATDNAAIGLSTAALVVSLYGASLPKLDEVRSHDDVHGHVAACEAYAAAVGAGVVVVAAVVTRSPEVALIGLTAVIGLSAAYAYARRAPAHPEMARAELAGELAGAAVVG